MEVDSKCVVDIVKRKENIINSHYRLVRDIKRMLNRSWEIKFAHIYREGNRCADAIANHALFLPQGLYILDELPHAVRKILMEDIMGVCFPRFCIV